MSVALMVLCGLLGVGGVSALPAESDGLIDGLGTTGAQGDSSDAAGAAVAQPTTAAGEALVGTFAITAGVCTSGPVPKGSWFRMVQPGGNATSGPFVDNNDSPCANKSATTLQPGADGGLLTGRHQPGPEPAFDSGGNGLADRIVKPQKFYGVGFAAATNPTDPQTGTAVAAPAVFNDNGALNGDLRSFAVAWNRQHFNQGAPKPNGSTPGQTSRPSGTYDRSSGAFVLEWSSQIEGGPFNGFTGVWHLEGTFRPSTVAAAGSGQAGGAPGVGGGAQTSGTQASAATGATGGGPTGAHPRTGAPAPWLAAAALVLLAGGRVARRVRS